MVLWDLAVLSSGLNLVILMVFPNLNDSMKYTGSGEVSCGEGQETVLAKPGQKSHFQGRQGHLAGISMVQCISAMPTGLYKKNSFFRRGF